MHVRSKAVGIIAAAALVLGVVGVGQSASASGSGSNLWSNSGLESGSGSLPTGWTAGGTGTSIAQWTTSTAHGGTHSLCVIDSSTTTYGTASSSMSVTAGNSYQTGWYQGYATSRPMSFTISFTNSGGSGVGSPLVLPLSGNSNGWLAASHDVTAPATATSMVITISSTGTTVDNTVTGSLCIDDISVLLVDPSSLGTGTNVWPNSGVESDVDGDGIPDGWLKGGSATSQDSWSTATAYDGTHSLCVVDASASDYGEWYTPPLPVVEPGLTYELRWEQGYSTGTSTMYYQTVFYDQFNNIVGSATYYPVSGNSSGWQAAMQLLTVPTGASRLSIHITSSVAGTGSVCLDAITLVPAKTQDPASDENLVPNSMLEVDSNSDGIPDNWSKIGPTAYQSQATWSTSQDFSPSHSLCVTRPSASNPTKTEEGGWLSDPISVIGGASYLLTFEQYFSTPAPTPPDSEIDLLIGAVFYNSSGASISNSLVMDNGSSGGWVKASRDLLAPNSATAVRLQIDGNTYSSGTICADDFFLSEPIGGTTPYATQMLNTPSSYSINNWATMSSAYEALAFSGTTVDGSELPATYTAGSSTTPSTCFTGTYTGTYSGAAFSLPSYLGESNDPTTGTPRCEALPDLGAIYGATLDGLSMNSYGGKDYVSEMAVYNSQVTDSGGVTRDLIYDNPSDDGTCADWYTAYPTILWAQILDHYSLTTYSGLETDFLAAADSWKSAIPAITATHGQLWCYDFKTGQALTFAQAFPNWSAQHGGDPTPNVFQPDLEIGAAWIEYLAWQRTGTSSYLSAAESAMTDLETHQSTASTPLYEVLAFFGPLLAAKMNAVNSQNLPVDTFLNWVFTNGYNGARNAYGMMADDWNGYSVDGLIGGSADWGGYAFGMDTNVALGAVAPVARYAPHDARTIGAWVMQVTNNEKTLFSSGLPSANQSEPSLATTTGEARVADIPYEGLKKDFNGQTPYATSDVAYFGTGSSTWSDRGVYSAWSTAILGTLVKTTNVSGVLATDLLASDTNAGSADPTYLYYNPNGSTANVSVAVGSSAVDLYNAVTHSFIAKNVTGTQTVSIASQQAAVLVFVPHTSTYTISGNSLKAGGVPIDFEFP